eukprot:PhM_4_TR8579/c0_g1_i2/m.39096
MSNSTTDGTPHTINDLKQLLKDKVQENIELLQYLDELEDKVNALQGTVLTLQNQPITKRAVSENTKDAAVTCCDDRVQFVTLLYHDDRWDVPPQPRAETSTPVPPPERRDDRWDVP